MWPAGRRSARPGRTKSWRAASTSRSTRPLAPNKIITDIDKAPRNARGRVEFSSDFFLIKPKQIERGNGTVLYEVSNRGGKGMLGFYNQATGSLDPTTDAQMGDGFLMTQGFTLLWVGWQFDPPHARRPRPRLSRPSPQTTASRSWASSAAR